MQSVCQDVPYGTVQRSQLLAAAADMLPPEVQAAHAADIQGRHHKEPLQPHVLRQVLQHCSMELPDAAGMPYQPTGEQLLALYAGPQLDRADSRSMPHAMTFSQYWRKLLQGSCTAPDLQPQVSVLPTVWVVIDKLTRGEVKVMHCSLGHQMPRMKYRLGQDGAWQQQQGCLKCCGSQRHLCLFSWLQVYEMGEAAARQQWQQRLLYTDAGSIARTGTNTLLAVTQVSDPHQLQLGSTLGLIQHRRRAHIAWQHHHICNTAQKSGTARTCPLRLTPPFAGANTGATAAA